MVTGSMNLVQVISSAKAQLMEPLLGDGLRSKAARGGVWLGSASFAEQLLRFARNMLLARLLLPGAFGEMAIVSASASLVTSFTDVGLWPAIIHNPRGAEPEYLNAAWWMGAARALFIYLLIFLFAPRVALFYGNLQLAPLLRVALLSQIFDGILSPRSKLAQKQMKLFRWAVISNGGAIIGVASTIVLSLITRSVWALAIGFAAENACRCLLSYIVYPGLPSLRMDRQACLEIMRFSRGTLGLSFLNLLFTRTDIFVLGMLYSPSELGLYSLAITLAQTPCTFLVQILTQTLMPAFSHVQADHDRVNRILNEINSWLILCGVPAVATVWLCSPSLLTVVYGHRYGAAAAADALCLAGIVALLNTFNTQLTNIFYATGRPGLHLRAVAASAVVMVVAVYPACRFFGLAGGQAAALLAIMTSYLLQIERARHVIGLQFSQYARALGPSLLAALMVLVAGRAAHLLGLVSNPTANIVLSVCIYLFACLCAVAWQLRRNRLV
jgi:O-antigen/teichoic acid export membrane protein